MLHRTKTRSAGRSTTVPRGGRTGGRTGRGGGRTGEPTGRVGGRTGDQDSQGGKRGNKANGGVDKVPDFSTAIAQQLQDLLPTIIAQIDKSITGPYEPDIEYKKEKDVYINTMANIMLHRTKTRSAGRSTTVPRGGRTGGRTGRGGGRTGEPTGRVGGRTGDQDSQGGKRGNKANGGVDKVPDFSTAIAQQLQDLLPTIIAQIGNHSNNIHSDVRNVNVNHDRGGCSYKEFLACNPKEFDGKGGAIAYTCYTEKIELVQTRGREAAVGMTWEDFKTLMREELCPNNEMQKLESEFWCHVMVEAGHAAYIDRFHELARLVPHLVTRENKRIERYTYGLAPYIHRMVAATEPTTIQSAVLKARVLTDEEIRNGSLKKNTKKSGNSGEPSRDGNVKGDNKRSRTGRAFATTTNPVKKEYTSSAPKCKNYNFYHHPEMPCHTCTNCNRLGHFAKDCRAGQKRVNPLNTRNSIAARGACFECGEEARQDPNIVTGTFTLNNHYATTLFDSGADSNFVFTTFIPLLDIEPNNLEINKVIRDFKLEIEGYTFDIDLIPFRHESFDVIVGMDWLSRHKAEIV
nr:hypothetical protein [Tanacetum cinerariifolium]